METDDGDDRHLLSVDSIKVIAESIGISALDEEVCKRLTEDLEFRLKEVVQNAIKFMRQSKRRILKCSDIDCSLKVKNIEPLYGFECADYIPLRHTSGGGKTLYYPDDQEMDLISLISTPLPKLPCEVTLRTHWLAVEGVQPVIVENIPPVSLEKQMKQAIAVSLPGEKDVIMQSKEVRLDRKRKKEKDDGIANGDWMKLKPLHSHSLSLEQQLYYKELTDACIGMSDSKRQEAYTSLCTDPGLYQLLPHLTSFITEGIKINIAQRKLLALKHLLRMTKALLDNDTISIEKFLHELIPAVLSCCLNRQLCTRPEAEDHWAIRDLAAKILAFICKEYSNSVNNIQTRVTRILSQALGTNSHGLANHYGAVMVFVELGHESVVACILPRLKQEGEFIKIAQVTTSGPFKVVEQIAANKLQLLLQRHCAPCLLQIRSHADSLQSYQNDYGYLGTALFSQVKALRQVKTGLTMQRVTTSSVKSPTSPLSSPSGKLKPPPLTIPSPQVTATKIQTSKGTYSISSPTLAAALRVQIAQASSSQHGGTPVATIPVSLLSAVVNNPTIAQAVLASQLSTSEPISSPSLTPVQENSSQEHPTTSVSRHSSTSSQ